LGEYHESVRKEYQNALSYRNVAWKKDILIGARDRGVEGQLPPQKL